jgi:hypothetical protein
MNPWLFLLIGYPFTIAIETPILMLGLSPRHSMARRVFAGVWLTACTYPIVVLVLPHMLLHTPDDRTFYLIVAETFAPIAECAIFWLAFGSRAEWGRYSMWRDFYTIVWANLMSFTMGEWMSHLQIWEKMVPSS